MVSFLYSDHEPPLKKRLVPYTKEEEKEIETFFNLQSRVKCPGDKEIERFLAQCNHCTQRNIKSIKNKTS